MKIVISGCAGIGKTTLARDLADALGVACIGENYQPLFDPPGGFTGPPQQLAERFTRVLNRKRLLEKEAGDFVVDRGPIDLFNLWLASRLGRLAQLTSGFAAVCRDFARQYDYVVFPPYGVLPLRPHDVQDGRVRVQNEWVQLRNHAAILGLALLWLPQPKVLQLPADAGDPAQRVEWLRPRLATAPET